MDVIAHDKQRREPWRAGVETRMQVAAINGAAQLCIFEQWIQPGVGAPTHFHAVEEVLTVIAGEAEMWIEEEHAVLTAGQSLLVPGSDDTGFATSAPECCTSMPYSRRLFSRRRSTGLPSR